MTVAWLRIWTTASEYIKSVHGFIPVTAGPIVSSDKVSINFTEEHHLTADVPYYCDVTMFAKHDIMFQQCIWGHCKKDTFLPKKISIFWYFTKRSSRFHAIQRSIKILFGVFFAQKLPEPIRSRKVNFVMNSIIVKSHYQIFTFYCPLSIGLCCSVP